MGLFLGSMQEKRAIRTLKTKFFAKLAEYYAFRDKCRKLYN